MGTACGPINRLEVDRCASRPTSDSLRKLNQFKGCDKLATIEENLIIGFTPLGTSDEMRLAIVLNRADQVCGTVSLSNIPMVKQTERSNGFI